MSGKRIPKYVQLKQEICSWLESGEIKANAQLPSENEIAARFGMSRQTVRQTLGEMEKEGLLYRLQGKGTFASPPKAAEPDRKTIGMLTTHISDYIFPHIVRGAEAELRGQGYRLLLSSTENNKEKERENLRLMLEQPLSGLIIEPTKSAQGNPNLDLYLALQMKRIPMIMINARYPEMSCPCLRTDDEAGGFAAAEHLIRLGHERIAGFFKTDDLQGVGRLKGFLRAHEQYESALPPDAVVLYTTEEKEDKPFQALLDMLRRDENRPSAVVCYNDELAVKLLDAVRLTGLSVPDDLSIVGFDDSFLATATEVKLTTLAHPKQEMGVNAARMLVSMIEGADGEKQAHDEIVYRPELIVRHSTKRHSCKVVRTSV